MTRLVQWVYTALGTGFVLLGALSLLGAAAAWHEFGVVAWRTLGYGALSAGAAYGLFTRQEWLVPLFALNVAGIAAIVVLSWPQPAVVASFAVAAALFAFVRLTLRPAASTAQGGVGGLCIALWLLLLFYTLLTISL